MSDISTSESLDDLLVQQIKPSRLILDPWPDIQCPKCRKYNLVYLVKTQEIITSTNSRNLTQNGNVNFQVRKIVESMSGDYDPSIIEQGFFCAGCKKRLNEETLKEEYKPTKS